MDNWSDNVRVVASGGGSSQARSHDCGGDCPICNGEREEGFEEEDHTEEA